MDRWLDGQADKQTGIGEERGELVAQHDDSDMKYQLFGHPIGLRATLKNKEEGRPA